VFLDIDKNVTARVRNILMNDTETVHGRHQINQLLILRDKNECSISRFRIIQADSPAHQVHREVLLLARQEKIESKMRRYVREFSANVGSRTSSRMAANEACPSSARNWKRIEERRSLIRACPTIARKGTHSNDPVEPGDSCTLELLQCQIRRSLRLGKRVAVPGSL
jgi:hypothetical protein